MALVINSENAIRQDFPFRQSFIDYLFKNANVSKKLYRTCKYFYELYPFHMIDEIYFTPNFNIVTEIIKLDDRRIHIIEKEIKFNDKNPLKEDDSNKIFLVKSRNLINAKNLWISQKIHYQRCKDFAAKRLPWWISRISRCTIKELKLGFKLTEKEFKILTKEETIKKLEIQKVIYSNGDFMAVEDIVAAVPNAISVGIENSHVTPLTSQKLSSMNRKKKYQEFILSQVDKNFDENEFFEFMKKHGSPGLPFLISFAPPITKEKTGHIPILHFSNTACLICSDSVSKTEVGNPYPRYCVIYILFIESILF